MTSRPESDALLLELHEFLTSSATNVEWMGDRLRAALNVSTGLESVIRLAVEQGRSVAIAGTAGSGKTHLLRTAAADGRYKIVTDLAALPKGEWKSLFGKGSRVIVAGNEGAFLLGKQKGYAGYAEVIDALHAIQLGREYVDDGPVVIDAAGFDPAGSHSICKMLQVPLLRTYVTRHKSELASVAWDMLSDSVVAERVASLVEAASAESDADGFTFRQLWQLVADLIVGSEPNEPWFRVLFAGSAEVTRWLSHTFNICTVPLPHIGNQLWHADLNRLKPAFLDSAIPVLERMLARNLRLLDEDERLSHFADLRRLAIFGLKSSPIDSMLRSGSDLWIAIGKGECSPLLQAINRYFAFGLIEFGDDVELWLQHDTERRDLKPDIQISLGTAPANEFALIRSHVVANRPSGIAPVLGGRRLLLHRTGGAVLSVSKDLVDGILRTRSHRVHDRKDVEYDWRVSQFFEQVAVKAARPDRLKVAKFDFQARTGRLMTWQIGESVKRVAV